MLQFFVQSAQSVLAYKLHWITSFLLWCHFYFNAFILTSSCGSISIACKKQHRIVKLLFEVYDMFWYTTFDYKFPTLSSCFSNSYVYLQALQHCSLFPAKIQHTIGIQRLTNSTCTFPCKQFTYVYFTCSKNTITYYSECKTSFSIEH